MRHRDFLPEDFVRHLQSAIPGFLELATKHQFGIAWMLWVCSTKRRQHSHFDGHASFSHEEINERLGRGGFKRINEQLDLFEVTHWSMDDGFTKGYLPTTRAQQARASYFSQDRSTPTRLAYRDSGGLKTLKSPPPAVASRDMRGLTTTQWRRAKGLARTQVDLDALGKLGRWLTTLGGSCCPIRAARISVLLEATAQVSRLSMTDVGGRGVLLHQYTQAESGRLYASGVNLQTAPRRVRRAALNGQWEYDISNCHFTILCQMAAKFAQECPGIERYLRNKQAIRSAIATEVGITIEQVKTVLLATLYGARASTSPEAAIPGEIGSSAAARLYAVDAFHAIKADIARARRTILEGWPPTRNGRLKNAFGSAISRDRTPEQQLAHLLQGVEALALKAVIDMHPNDICLVQHDGWASPNPLDVDAVETAILAATGYDLKVEEVRVALDLTDDF